MPARYLFVLQFWAVAGLLLVEGPLGDVANDLQQERVCAGDRWRGGEVSGGERWVRGCVRGG